MYTIRITIRIALTMLIIRSPKTYWSIRVQLYNIQKRNPWILFIGSGGILVTVKGRFLDSVAFPFLVTHNAQTNQQSKMVGHSKKVDILYLH